MAVTILDPTNEAVPVERQITPRPEAVSYTHLTLPTSG